MESNQSAPPPAPATVYGYCPVCGKPGHDREKQPNGNDTCESGHSYPSATALHAPLPPGHARPETDAGLRLELESLRKQIHDQTIANGQLLQQIKARAGELAKLRKELATRDEKPTPPGQEGGKK